jgi:hypothetical protein
MLLAVTLCEARARSLSSTVLLGKMHGTFALLWALPVLVAGKESCMGVANEQYRTLLTWNSTETAISSSLPADSNPAHVNKLRT